MQIEKDKVVTFHYRVSEVDGPQLEDSSKGNPIVYLHGHSGMLAGVEQALSGKVAGDHITVTLAPQDAYGMRQDSPPIRIPNKHVLGFNKKVKYKPGMIVQINTKNGPMEVVVIKAGLKTIDVDTNHPYAGKTLTFDIDVLDVRDAAPEEISHGHAHGPGGHHH